MSKQRVLISIIFRFYIILSISRSIGFLFLLNQRNIEYFVNPKVILPVQIFR